MSSDDEVQYLGSSRAQGHQRPLTGVALNVDRSANFDAHRLVFYRKNTRAIQVGRRPGEESPRTQFANAGDALFRCAVVSRRHAKIAFSDNGHLYIVDLNSHHGTHVRKLGDSFSKMLAPEVPTLLAQGDTITFGKTVGRSGEDCVHPVVVRVDLLRDPESIKPLYVPSASPASDKLSSGRYGIYASADSSDEMLDSDSAPETPSPRKEPLRLRIDDDTLAPIDPWNSYVSLPSLKDVVGGDHFQTSRSHSPMDLASPSGDEPPIIGAWFSSPKIEAVSKLQEEPAHVPNVTEQHESDVGETVQPNVVEAVQPDVAGEHAVAGEPAMAGDESESESASQAEPTSTDTAELQRTVAKLQEQVDKLHTHRRKYRLRFNSNVRTLSDRMASYDNRIKDLQEQQTSLSDAVDDLVNMDVPTISSDIEDIRGRVQSVVDVDIPSIQAQIVAVEEDVDIAAATREDDEVASNEEIKALQVDVKERIDKLSSLLNELKDLQTRAQEQVDKSLKDMQETAEASLAKMVSEMVSEMTRATIAANTQAFTSAPVPTLKRKRLDEDEGDDDDEIPPADQMDAEQITVVDPSSLEPVPLSATTVTVPTSSTPPRKRARTVAGAIVRGTAAVTIGAVAAWSALAFT